LYLMVIPAQVIPPKYCPNSSHVFPLGSLPRWIGLVVFFLS
jgi:hypothetical protein